MNIRRLAPCLIALCLSCVAGFAQSAAEVLSKTVDKVANAGSINCNFSVSSPNGSGSASFESSGRKFKLKAPGATTWFDGTNMWTSNDHTREVTLVKPTSEELKESNPFEYLTSYKSEYNVFFSKRKDSKNHLVLLNPKRKGGEVKAVEIDIDKTSLLPVRFIVRDRNDKVTTVSITSLSLNKGSGNGSFTFPADAMSDYEIIDLR